MSSAGPKSILVQYHGFKTVATGVEIRGEWVATQPTDLAKTGTFSAVYLPSDNIAQINNKVIAAVIAEALIQTGLVYLTGQVKIPSLT